MIRALASGGTRPAAGPPADLDPPVPVVVTPVRPLRVVSAAVMLGLAALVVWSVLTNPRFDWPVVQQYLWSHRVLTGLWLTVWLTAVATVGGFVLGTGVAVLRMSDDVLLRTVAGGYVWFFRATPLLVQVIVWFNIGALYPTMFGHSTVDLIGPTTAAAVGLVLHETAYAAEIVRSGMLSVATGQIEAARGLGMSRARTLRRVVLPQAMSTILPGAGNLLIGTLKGTAVVSVLAVGDLLYSVQLIYTDTFEIIPLLIVATAWYVAVTTVLSLGQALLERRVGRGRPARGRLWTSG